MARDFSQKIKLLKIWEMLRQTDAEHPLGAQEILSRLDEMGIPCERRAFYRDIAMLQDWGYPVQCAISEHKTGYFVPRMVLTDAELKVLIDAVQAARFIPEAESETLIAKLADMTSGKRREILRRTKIRFNCRKSENSGVFSTVECLENAIAKKKKAVFYYFDLDENKNRVYRKNRLEYAVCPLSLVYADDNYYLIAYSDEHQALRHYRIDRMEDARMTGEPIPAEVRPARKDLSEYTRQLFRMYAGPAEKVTLVFDDSLIGVIFDRFGMKTKITRIDEHTCRTTVTVQTGPTFTGWLAQFGDKMCVADKIDKAVIPI